MSYYNQNMRDGRTDKKIKCQENKLPSLCWPGLSLVCLNYFCWAGSDGWQHLYSEYSLTDWTRGDKHEGKHRLLTATGWPLSLPLSLEINNKEQLSQTILNLFGLKWVQRYHREQFFIRDWKMNKFHTFLTVNTSYWERGRRRSVGKVLESQGGIVIAGY